MEAHCGADRFAEMNGSIIKRAVELNDPALAKEALREIDVLFGASSDENERVYLLFSRASCYGILGNFEEARRQLSSALRERPDDCTQATFDFMQGLLSQQEGNYGEAFESLSATLSAHCEQLKRPELRFMYEDIQQRRGFLLVSLSRFQEAIPILTEVLSFNIEEHSRSDAFAGLGLSYLEIQEYNLAKDHFLQAIAIGLTKRWEGEAHFYLGIAYSYSNLLQEAKREFQTCEELATRHPLPIMDVYAWLSSICKRLGETSEAERYSRLAKPT